ncbi:MAG: hypothetical protein CUR32_07660 [Flavobacterium sp.]|nr:MAG: hypothetical protein CUR32_07660 [Flavobacterium sp.] [Flavobacterium sp. FEMGT703F]
MKKSITSLLLLAGLYATAQVKVGDNPNTINASAVLEMESTNKGLLPPRMTTLQRDAISNPAKGLAIFNTTSNSLEVNTGTPASPVWSSAKSGDVNNTTLTSSTSPAGTSLGQMMYNTGAVQPTGLVYWDGTQWKSVASSGGDTTNNFPVTNNSAVTNNSTVTNNNPVTNNSTSTFNGVSTFNDQAVFNDTAVFNNGMKVGNLQQGAITDSLMVFEPNTKEVRRLSIAGAAAAGEPWYKVGTTTGATSNTDNVYLNGNVGIGTNNPTTNLEVSSSAVEATVSVSNTGSNQASFDFKSSGVKRWRIINTENANHLSFYDQDDAAERMRIDGSSGNVGIGTSTPFAPLHVSTTGANGVAIERNGIAAASARLSLYKKNDGGAVTNDSSIGSVDFYAYNGTGYEPTGQPNASIVCVATEDQTTAHAGGALVFKTASNGTTTPLERMRINQGGNVAINTMDHGAMLNMGGRIASTTATYDPFVTLAATDGPIGTLYHSYNGSKSYIGLQSFVPGDGEKTPIVLGEWGGAVAIGTNNPVAKFTIAGDGIADWDQSQMFMSNTGTGGHTWAMGPRALGTAGDFSISDESDGQIRMTIQGGTGNVGIGTDTPSGKLDVSSAGPTTVNIANTGDNQASLDFINNGVKRWRLINQTTSNNFTIYDQDTNAERLHIDGTTGYVAIGGGMSPKAPLHIGGTTSASFSTGGISYFNGGIASIATAPSTGPRTDASIIAEGNIWSKASIVGVASLTFSDKRIKSIIGQSDATKDLDLLNKIRITDYRMKDVVMQGNKQYKKVIAQEVEAIYPEAVTKQTGFVPNIYQPADKVVRLGNNTYKVSFTNKVEYNTNVTGDLKLYDEQKEITAKVVSKADNEIVFTTAEEMKGDKLFLFGEEVTDFRAVDYEALSTLNISATQELYREIQALKKQNAVLTAQVGDTKKLETAYNELAAQVKAMQEVLNMPKVQDGTVAERR